jgi:hypothetical protein
MYMDIVMGINMDAGKETDTDMDAWRGHALSSILGLRSDHLLSRQNV